MHSCISHLSSAQLTQPTTSNDSIILYTTETIYAQSDTLSPSTDLIPCHARLAAAPRSAQQRHNISVNSAAAACVASALSRVRSAHTLLDTLRHRITLTLPPSSVDALMQRRIQHKPLLRVVAVCPGRRARWPGEDARSEAQEVSVTDTVAQQHHHIFAVTHAAAIISEVLPSDDVAAANWSRALTISFLHGAVAAAAPRRWHGRRRQRS
jgi:hypothetical protein